METKTIFDKNPLPLEKNKWSIPLIIATLTIMGICIGTTTNAINGQVSERYFRTVMGWYFIDIKSRAIFHGILEGGILGLILSLIYSIGYSIITKRRTTNLFIFKHISKMVLIVYISWILGGILAIFLAFTFSETYDQLIIGVPQETLKRIAYAWVGGSIQGSYSGGLLGIGYGLFKTKKEWRKMSA